MQGDWQISTLSGTEPAKPRSTAAIIAELAGRQHGVVALDQLEALRLSPSGVRSRVARGLLHRIHYGVYAVGHPLLSAKGRWMAAVLACGAGAALSHRSAAALQGLLAVGSRLEVSSPGRSGRSRPGIEVHSGATLAPSDVAVVDGIRCTTVPRTLLDLAEVVPPAVLARACEQAELLRLLDARAAEDILRRGRGRAGARALRAALAAWRPHTALTRRELERRFLELCRSARLAPPSVNTWVPECALEVDFLWRAQRLVVETDSHRFHGTRPAFERDRRRDQRLLVAGFAVARFTWRQVVDEPLETAATLRSLLRASR
jgi:very-short-patch-repair endonuclease